MTYGLLNNILERPVYIVSRLMSRKPNIKKLILQGDAHANIQDTSLCERINIMHTFANKIFLAMNMNYLTLVRLKLTNSCNNFFILPFEN